jgi:hypothetical protein
LIVAPHFASKQGAFYDNFYKELVNFFSSVQTEKKRKRSSAPVVIIKREREDNTSSDERTNNAREKFKPDPEVGFNSSPLLSFLWHPGLLNGSKQICRDG